MCYLIYPVSKRMRGYRNLFDIIENELCVVNVRKVGYIVRRILIGILAILFSSTSVFFSASAGSDDLTYIDRNVDLTCISRVQKMKDDNGERLNGKGIIISIIDSGIQETGDDRIIDRFDFCTNTEDISDDLDHGAKVKHIISYIAPEASILAYKVFLSENRKGSVKAVADAIKRSIEHKADIINISGGINANEVLLKDAIELAAKEGVIIVSGAGNEGRNCGITSPGNDARVITVGATTLAGDDVADYSSRGPDPDTGELKPDVVAPGDYSWGCRGTSFASPIVTGAVALLLQKHPTWTSQDMKSALGSTAVLLKKDGELLLPTAQGSGRIDVLKAITTSTLFSSAQICFNQDTAKLKIRNIGEKPLRYSLQWVWNGAHEGLLEHLTPSSFTLQPGAETSISITLKTDPVKIDRLWYYSNLRISSEATAWNIPIVVDSPHTFAAVEQEGMEDK